MELAAYILGLLLSAFLSLPPPLQVAVLVALGWSWTYKRGWNGALALGRDAAIRQAKENYKRLKR